MSIVRYIYIDMDAFGLKKKNLENQIVETMLSASGNGIITDNDLSIVANVILSKMDYIYDDESYESFLQDITNRWDFFKPLLVLEKSEDKEKMEEESIKKALMLVHQGDIEAAIETAKNANQTLM